jgi:hypothetical protein
MNNEEWEQQFSKCAHSVTIVARWPLFDPKVKFSGVTDNMRGAGVGLDNDVITKDYPMWLRGWSAVNDPITWARRNALRSSCKLFVIVVLFQPKFEKKNLHVFVKLPSIKLHEKHFSSCKIVTCGQTDIAKLTENCCNSVESVPENERWKEECAPLH